MVAITTDTAHHLVEPSGRSINPTVALRLAPRREPAEPTVLIRRVLLAIVAVVVVAAVMVGTAAFGRVLDGQRGIPAVWAPAAQHL